MKALIISSVILLSSVTAAAQTNWFNSFLIRHNYLAQGGKGVYKANAYRISNYTMIRKSTFMGKKVQLNRRVIKSMKCVEVRIKSTCTDDYKPANISSWRTRNTIGGAEISDHVFGTAMDFDPHLNPCCGCVKNWAKAPRCTGEGVVEHEHGPRTGRYVLPQCWIDSFKAEGWFWYGDDTSLRDTMHFSFVGAPDQGCK